MELITRAEFAKRMNVSAPAITKAIKRGRIKVDEETNMIDFDTHKTAFEGKAPAIEGSLADWQLKKEMHNSGIAEMKEQIMRGELIERTLVNNVLFPKLRNIRDAIMSIPDRCVGSIVASITSSLPDGIHVDSQLISSSVHQAMSTEILQILQEVSDAETWEKHTTE